MKPITTAEADRIIKSYLSHDCGDDSSGYDWLRSRSNLENVVSIDAIELTGLTLMNLFEGRYLLVYIEHYDGAPAISDQVSLTEAEILRECAEWSMPHSARMRLNARYPRGTTFHWDPVAELAYSGLDLPHLDEATRKRLQNTGGYAGVFSRTDGGTAELLAEFTEDELRHHHAARAQAVERAGRDVVRMKFSQQHPYRLRVQETDEAGWLRALPTREAADQLIADIRTRGAPAVTEHMVPFTPE